MAENNNPAFLKIVLIIFAIVSFVYGITFFFAPDYMVSISGTSEEVFHGWLRWPGGLEIAMGIGAILVFLKPENQGIIVTTMALGCLFIGAALLWAWCTLEEGSNVWFTAAPTIISFGLSVLLWWSRQSAKDILYKKADKG